MNIRIISSNSLPMLNGVAINATLRAAYLARAGHDVTLVVPWLEPQEQHYVAANLVCSSPDAQRRCILDWLDANQLPAPALQIAFFRAYYDRHYQLNFPRELIEQITPQCDLLVLEEPEILMGKRPWASIKQRFLLVIGIIHTNYAEIAQHDRWLHRKLASLYGRLGNSIATRNCHKVITIDRLVEFPAAEVAYVVGIADEFFAQQQRTKTHLFYCAGRMDKFKGWQELAELSANLRMEPIDVYNTPGRHQDTILSSVAAHSAPLRFCGPTLQPARTFGKYKCLINPSRLEVLNTTTRQALCMGQFVILPYEHCNLPYYQFPNCLVYRSPTEFERHVEYVRSHDPALVGNEIHSLSWQSATENLLEIAQNIADDRGIVTLNRL
ncbi:hypothetical protein HC891_02815 [Candidatus Gracilibacteria bacterium]|nr:hypothetical protein [Candidatus Gracilibacteria bacterium]